MKDCRRWRNSNCPGDASCSKWAHCTLMNDDAVPEGMRPEDYQKGDTE